MSPALEVPQHLLVIQSKVFLDPNLGCNPGKVDIGTKNGTQCFFSCQDFVFQHWLVMLLPFQPAQKSLAHFRLFGAEHHDKTLFLELVLQTFAAKGEMQGGNCPRNKLSVCFFSQSNLCPWIYFTSMSGISTWSQKLTIWETPSKIPRMCTKCSSC